MRARIGLPEIISCGLVVIMFVVLLAQVILRPFGLGFVWAEEFAVTAFMALVYFGTAAAYRQREHMAVDVFAEWATKRLTAAQQRLWARAVSALELVFLAILAIGLAQMTNQMWGAYAGSITGFRIGWLFLVALIATAMCIGSVVFQIIDPMLLTPKDVEK